LPAFSRFCKGDKDADNTIIAGLARPSPTADKALGGHCGYPPDSRKLGIGHAAGSATNRKRNI
jgi:hypothetical protein